MEIYISIYVQRDYIDDEEKIFAKMNTLYVIDMIT